MQEEANRPTVVVIIPFYNGANWVERAIKSVVTQTVRPDEFLIVNDGSKSEERATLDPLSIKYGFKIIDKENGGQGSARNLGVEMSTSDYICFLDQDDFYLPNHIEALTQAIPKKTILFGFVYADLYVGDGDGNIIYTDVVRSRGPHPKRSATDMLSHDIFVLPSASIISKKAFVSVGGFDPQFMGYEDDDLFLRIFRAGYSNHWHDEAVTVWCIHGESTSYSIKMVRSRFKYFKKLNSTFPDNPERGLFYVRDCLIPRFSGHFIEEVKTAIKKKSQHLPEILGMLYEFQTIVDANENVSVDYKKYLVRTINAIQGLPVPINSLGIYQDGLRQVYSSTSWKVTQPLRLIYRKVKGLPEVAETIPYDENEAQRKLEELLQSSSWKLTAFIRVLKRIISPQPIHQEVIKNDQPKTEFLAKLAR